MYDTWTWMVRENNKYRKLLPRLLLLIAMITVLIVTIITVTKSNHVSDVIHVFDNSEGGLSYIYNDDVNLLLMQCLMSKCDRENLKLEDEMEKCDYIHYMKHAPIVRILTNQVENAANISIDCKVHGHYFTSTYTDTHNTQCLENSTNKCTKCNRKLHVVTNWAGKVVMQTRLLRCNKCGEYIRDRIILGKPAY